MELLRKIVLKAHRLVSHFRDTDFSYFSVKRNTDSAMKVFYTNIGIGCIYETAVATKGGNYKTEGTQREEVTCGFSYSDNYQSCLTQKLASHPVNISLRLKAGLAPGRY